MKKLALVLLALAVTVGTAHAVDINGKKGIGVASAIGGPGSFAFNYGTGNMNIEGLLGVDLAMPKDGETGYTLKLGAGVHYHALRAEQAAWTIGGRVNIGLNQPPIKDADSVTQFGIDIPMRVYWFPNKNLSLHWEGGIAIAIEGDKGGVFTGNGEGNYIGLLSPFAGMGATFWW